jgi:PGF-CTERM protein
VAIGDYQVSKSVRVRPGSEESITVRTDVGESRRVLDVTVDGRKVGVVRVGGASTSSGAGPGFGPIVALVALGLTLVVRRLQY